MHNPWKLTAIAMALIVVTALVTGVVVASRRPRRHRPRLSRRVSAASGR